MNLKDVIAKLPDDVRTEAEKVIQEAIAAGNPLVGITTKEQAAEFIQKNQLFRAALDADISDKVARHDERFQKEKLPGIVEAEIKKRNPEKDPLRIELDTLKAEREAEKAELKREKLRALAIKKAADSGIPSDDIERFLGDDEDKTVEQVEAFAKRWKAYADTAVEKALKEKLGNVGKPFSAGAPQVPLDLESQYKAALASGDADRALILQGRLQSAARS